MLIEIYEMVYKIRNTLLSLKESVANTGNPPATASNKQVSEEVDVTINTTQSTQAEQISKRTYCVLIVLKGFEFSKKQQLELFTQRVSLFLSSFCRVFL